MSKQWIKIIKNNDFNESTLNYDLVTTLLKSLPFVLTEDQKNVINEITNDIKDKQTNIPTIAGFKTTLPKEKVVRQSGENPG